MYAFRKVVVTVTGLKVYFTITL